MITDQLKDAFKDLACRLSPENLACDGEISRAETARRLRQCVLEWRALEAQAGRKVLGDEVFNWEMEQHNLKDGAK